MADSGVVMDLKKNVYPIHPVFIYFYYSYWYLNLPWLCITHLKRLKNPTFVSERATEFPSLNPQLLGMYFETPPCLYFLNYSQF